MEGDEREGGRRRGVRVREEGGGGESEGGRRRGMRVREEEKKEGGLR